MTATTTLFDLSSEAAALARRIDEAATDLLSDDPDEAAAAGVLLELLLQAEEDNRDALLAKADSYCWVINTIVARGQARLEHARRLKALAERDASAAEDLKDRLISALLRSDPAAVRFDLPRHHISSRKTTAVELDVEPIDLPEEFQRRKITIEADKTALKDAIKAGVIVDGCQLVERRSWKLS
jgi:hypothetical protein